MDLRRHGSIEPWYFGLGDDTLGEVEWYVAPPGARIWSESTPFRSLDWWDGLAPCADRPGPIKGQAGSYTKGATVPGYTGGEKFCGKPEWFVEGIPSPPPPNPGTNPEGIPVCCGPTGVNHLLLALQWSA